MEARGGHAGAELGRGGGAGPAAPGKRPRRLGQAWPSGRRAVAGRGRDVRPGAGGGEEAVLSGRRRTWSVSSARAAGLAPPERRRPFCPPAEKSPARPTRSGDLPLRRHRRARRPLYRGAAPLRFGPKFRFCFILFCFQVRAPEFCTTLFPWTTSGCRPVPYHFASGDLGPNAPRLAPGSRPDPGLSGPGWVT